MWARKRIDIGWGDLCAAYRASLGSGHVRAAQGQSESAFPGDDSIACLSVRSGFHLLLSELNLPRGSEVLMSAVTILDMARIIEHHGLVPVPIDLNPETMAPDVDRLRRNITPQTRAVLIAHLFGTILNLDALTAIASEHRLIFIEDCAQAFDGLRYVGHPSADVVMFSFGPIKTATALAGGILRVRDSTLRQRMLASQSLWPAQAQSEYRRRIRLYGMLKLISGRVAFRILVTICRLMKKDLDATLNGAVRNFPVDKFFENLCRQPCAGLMKTMSRRIRTFDERRQDRRAELGAGVALKIRTAAASSASQVHGQDCSRTPVFGNVVPGSLAARHVWWVLPVCVPDPDASIAELFSAGFDASRGSQLRAIPTPEGHSEATTEQSRQALANMIFLPLYPELTDGAANRMAEIAAAAVIAR